MAGGRALADGLDGYLPALAELDLAWNSLGAAGGGAWSGGRFWVAAPCRVCVCVCVCVWLLIQSLILCLCVWRR